ncbi:Alpha-galactosidase 2 [Hibiscus syriacus]|uniref:Alpha-galactosidase 2 n=1 Tax=Hibiscus syriacus TaxID=106335 RepID=A0A6A2YCY6_HIBSY|nr:Alpha-galactosidase 2 [Hibiscus syriacus]
MQMQQRCVSLAKNMSRKILRPRAISPLPPPPLCDIFINHRGIDTKRTIAGLLHDHLFRLGQRPFLDSMNMKPGDKLFGKIDPAIRSSELGVARFTGALEEAKYTVGLAFDTLEGDWSGFFNTATDAVIKNLVELEAVHSNKNTTFIVQGRQQEPR